MFQIIYRITFDEVLDSLARYKEVLFINHELSSDVSVTYKYKPLF